MKHININRLVLCLAVTAMPTFLWAEQCPAVKQVLVSGRWRTPPGWSMVPLSPLAATAVGNIAIQAQGLYQVYYLPRTQRLRCIYSKPGRGVVNNTYVMARPLTQFSTGNNGNWLFDKESNAWHCSILMPHAVSQRQVMPPKHCAWSLSAAPDKKTAS